MENEIIIKDDNNKLNKNGEIFLCDTLQELEKYNKYIIITSLINHNYIIKNNNIILLNIIIYVIIICKEVINWN